MAVITENPNLEQHDLTSEQFREYTFPDGAVIRIDAPMVLLLRKDAEPPTYGGGAHRVVDSDGIVHYIPRGWLELCWAPREGAPAVDF